MTNQPTNNITQDENEPMVQPYALFDLDDTLFQTWRKIEAWDLANGLQADDMTLATVNKRGEPLSFFTPKQAQFYRWLSHSTELIPVTARDRQEITRVKLTFRSWQVLTHGAVILQANGQPLTAWQTAMQAALQPYQSRLQAVISYLQQKNIDEGLAITSHVDDFANAPLMIYVAVKHRQKNHAVLQVLANAIATEFAEFDQYFYTHVNANNLAILPHQVHKQHAVSFLQQQYFDPNRASFGFGDSLADVPFLRLLDWYGTPKQGQLHEAVTQMLQHSVTFNS